MTRQQVQESSARFTVWVCAQGVCQPAFLSPTSVRSVPFCSCRVESKRAGARLGATYRFMDRLPVEVVPRSEAEALAETLEAVYEWTGRRHPGAHLNARQALAAYRSRHPKGTP